MKKFLLFVGVAMVAMTASAQKAERTMSLSQEILPAKVTNGSMSIVMKDNANFAKVKTAAESIELISVEPDEAGDGTEFTSTSSVEIYPTNKTVEYKGQTMNAAKTSLGNLAGCEWDILFDDAQNTFVIPVNQEYTDPQYGLIYMWGLIAKEDGIYYDDENDIVFTKNENGIFECERVGWAMKMTGDYEQYVWTSSWYPEWMIPNGVEHGSWASGSWSGYENPIFIEDLTDEINIYNFFGYSKLNMLVDEETGSVLIPMGQHVIPTSSNVDKDVYGYFINLVGCMLEDRSIYRDYDKEFTEAYFATIENIDGDNYIVDSSNNIVTDPNDGYMSLASNPDSDGAAYGAGWLHAVNFTLNEGSYKAVPTGIKNVNKNEFKGNGKVYNLAGQQVAANTKGIVIVNGKKMMNK